MQPSKKPRLDRNVWTTGLVSLFTDVSSEMLVPILPLFLAATLGAPAAAIGLIEGTAEAISSLMKGISGYIVDRTGHRKRLMLLGYGASNLLKPLMGFAGSWAHILTLRVADRTGKGIRATPRDSLIAESTPPEIRGKAFGLHRTMDTLGASIGPLATWLVLRYAPGQYRQVFWWALLPGVLAVLFLFFGVREARAEVRAPKSGPVLRGWSLALGALPSRLRRFILIAALFALGNSADAFLILKAQAMGLPTPLIPVAYFTMNAVNALLAYPLGAWSDKLGRKPLLIGGLLVFAGVYAGFAIGGAGWLVFPLFAVYGLYYALTDGIQRAYITDHAPAEVRGTALGTFNALTGLAALPASIVAGLLWDHVGAGAPFWVGSGLAGVAALLMAFWA